MTEQRYGYTYHRVLVDSARILDSQFDDAVIYVTGAQLEMLRNMTQYLHRLSTYVSDYQPGYYLSPTVEDYDDILAIVADLEDVLMGNPNTIWGYKDRWYEAIATQSTGESHTYARTTVVPEGYVYKLEQYSAVHTAGTTCAVLLTLDVGGSNPVLYDAPALPSDDWVYGPENMTLKEGDRITWRVTGLPLDDWAYLRVWGHTMVVPT